VSAEEVERKAMLLDRSAVLRVVSALRQYRTAATRLLSSRHSDGTADGDSTAVFSAAVKEAEEVLKEEAEGA
jgi:hypothetical protein